MSVNFTPNQNEYKNLGKFRFWCQKVLPLVYDDSVSYYELLCKVLQYLNDTIENVNLAGEDMTKLYNAYGLLQDYVNLYFDNLNVQNEIDKKLDDLVGDGTLLSLITPIAVQLSQPTVVTNTGEMTNVQKTYVLANNGHMYQYKNGSWVDTGLVYATNIENYLTYSTLSVDDLNDVIKLGVYKKGSAQTTPINLPPNESGVAFMLIVYSDNTTSHLYQMYWTYTSSKVYTRMRSGSGFTEWKRMLNEDDLLLLDGYLGWHSVLPSTDLNEVSELGVFFNGNVVATNVPPNEAGVGFMLLSFYGNNDTRLYQFYYSYSSGKIYTRYKRSTVFTQWVRLLDETDLATIQNNVIISKASDTEYNINFGDYRTRLVRTVASDINADLWNLLGVYQGSTTVVTAGTDIVGVIKEANASDFMGGVHGDEVNRIMYITCDGVEWDYSSEIYAKEIKVCMVSDLFRVGTTQKAFTRNVVLTITHNKIVGEVLFINNIEGLVLYDAPIGGMMAIPTSIMTGIEMLNYLNNGIPTSHPNNFSKVNNGGTLRWSNGSITVNNLIGKELESFVGGAVLYTDGTGRVKMYFYTDKSANRVLALGETLHGKYEYLFV